ASKKAIPLGLAPYIMNLLPSGRVDTWEIKVQVPKTCSLNDLCWLVALPASKEIPSAAVADMLMNLPPIHWCSPERRRIQSSKCAALDQTAWSRIIAPRSFFLFRRTRRHCAKPASRTARISCVRLARWCGGIRLPIADEPGLAHQLADVKVILGVELVPAELLGGYMLRVGGPGAQGFRRFPLEQREPLAVVGDVRLVGDVARHGARNIGHPVERFLVRGAVSLGGAARAKNDHHHATAPFAGLVSFTLDTVEVNVRPVTRSASHSSFASRRRSAARALATGG